MYPKTRAKRKYNNKTVRVNDLRFDSKKEGQRYIALKQAEQLGEVQLLKRQVRFPIKINGVLICTYVADFVYYDAAGKRTVEDCKGYRTREYILKRKLMLAVHQIEIFET